jgi:hypothetical protein
MNTSIYDKTDKGREEIATRKYGLAPRLRSLLVLVDGRRTDDELLRNVAGLGLTADSLAALLTQEYVVLSTSYGSTSYEAIAEGAANVNTTPSDQPTPTSTSLPTQDQVQQFQSLYDFYNKTIKSTMGLRGFTLQLKVEKAATLDDLRELRQPYLEGVLKAKGDDMARTLASQLDQLLQEARF